MSAQQDQPPPDQEPAKRQAADGSTRDDSRKPFPASPPSTRPHSADKPLGAATGSPWRWVVMAVFIVGYLVVHFFLAGHLLEQTNITDAQIRGGDQKHNLQLALLNREDLEPDFTQGVMPALQKFVPHRTDGVVNPLWPWVAAWLADPEHEISGFNTVTTQDRLFFNRGRWFNVGLTAGFLIALGLAAARVFSLPSAINLVLLGGLGALLPRATYFQPEPLFYIFFFLTWLGCLILLRWNPLWLYLITGLWAGLAYLAKGAITPLLLAFLAVTAYRFVVGVVLPAYLAGGLHRPGCSFSWRNHFLGLIFLVLAFAAVTGPRLQFSAERYGDPFHSYPAYWMWMDDFTEGYAWMMNHNNAEKLDALAPEEKPSALNYLRQHPWPEISGRLVDGTYAKTGELLWPRTTTRRAEGPRPWKRLLDHRGWYLGGLLACLALAALMYRFVLSRTKRPDYERTGMRGFGVGEGDRIPNDAGVVVLFVVGSTALYALAYGWYHPIGRGDRFMLSLYLPVVFSLIYAFEGLLKIMRQRGGPEWPRHVALTAQWLLTGVLVWRIVELLRWPTFDGA